MRILDYASQIGLVSVVHAGVRMSSGIQAYPNHHGKKNNQKNNFYYQSALMGGYMATAINDFIQGMIMLGGIVAVIGAVLSGQGGVFSAVRSLSTKRSGSVESIDGIIASKITLPSSL